MKARWIISLIISLLLFVLWLYASYNKLVDPEFKDQLHKSPYLDKIADLVEVTLPIGELAIALLLVFERTRLLGLYFSFFLMFLFTAYLYSMLNFSYYKPCACGGILSDMEWDTHLRFNVIITIVAAIGVFVHPDKKRDDAPELITQFNN